MVILVGLAKRRHTHGYLNIFNLVPVEHELGEMSISGPSLSAASRHICKRRMSVAVTNRVQLPHMSDSYLVTKLQYKLKTIYMMKLKGTERSR